MTDEPVWVPVELVLKWHDRLILEFGGAPGIRDRGLLEGALDRPRNRLVYEPATTVVELGAIYGVAVAKAHAFLDGNKRIAFAVMVSFLRAHGHVLDATEAEATDTMLAVAAGAIDDAALATWLAGLCRGDIRA